MTLFGVPVGVPLEVLACSGARVLDFSRLLDALKLGPVPLSAVLVGSSIVLFGPEWLVRAIGLGDLGGGRTWIGIAWLASGALLTAHGLAKGLPGIRSRWIHRKNMAARRKYLETMTPEEQFVLSCYIENKTRTQTLPFNDGVVAGLENVGVIYKASTISQLGEMWAYNLQPWAWHELASRPELLSQADQGQAAWHRRRARW